MTNAIEHIFERNKLTPGGWKNLQTIAKYEVRN